MKAITLAALLAVCPAAAFAQASPECSDLFAARGFALPPPEIDADAASQIIIQVMMPFGFDSSLIWDGISKPYEQPAPGQPQRRCSLPQMAAMIVNLDAMATAQPPEDAGALYGTWASDNVLTEVAGLTLPGQEVLVIGPPIGPDPQPGAISITQDWYRALAPAGTSRWTEDGDYTGRVVQGDLAVAEDGWFLADVLEAPLTYSGTTFLEERGEDLFVKSQINRFDGAIEFLLDGDTLVMNYQSVMPIYRVPSVQTATYHRVAEGAPAAALRLVSALALPQARYLDCLTRKMTAEDPALAALLHPFDLEEVNAMTRDLMAIETQRFSGMERLKGQEVTEDDRKAVVALMEREFAIERELVEIGPILEDSGICPDLVGLRIGVW